MTRSRQIILDTERVTARNYDPLPVVITEALDIWAWDAEGRRYLDCISAYSSLNQGHRHPRVIDALLEQARRVTLTSRAVHNDRMGGFLDKLCRACGMDMALPMNTGAEAVETAIKLARKWGYRTKGVPRDQAEIIVCRNNFHGRTTTLAGLSTEPKYREDFGPYAPGFRTVEFGDAAALETVMTPRTVALLLEPIQAEAGIIVPPAGYLREARRICAEHQVLLALDEIQTGLGRTGKLFDHQHELDAPPDILVLGKALGGGVYPVSAVVSSAAVMGLLQPGEHGSTFGGNPLAAAVGDAALDVILKEELAERSAQLGAYLFELLNGLRGRIVTELRGRGLLLGLEIAPAAGTARSFCERLLEHGVLAKDTHEQVIRLAPPLTIQRENLDWLAEQLYAVLG